MQFEWVWELLGYPRPTRSPPRPQNDSAVAETKPARTTPPQSSVPTSPAVPVMPAPKSAPLNFYQVPPLYRDRWSPPPRMIGMPATATAVADEETQRGFEKAETSESEVTEKEMHAITPRRGFAKNAERRNHANCHFKYNRPLLGEQRRREFTTFEHRWRVHCY